MQNELDKLTTEVAELRKECKTKCKKTTDEIANVTARPADVNTHDDTVMGLTNIVNELRISYQGLIFKIYY